MKKFINRWWTPNKKSWGLILAGILGLLWTEEVITNEQFTMFGSLIAGITGIRMFEKGKDDGNSIDNSSNS